MLFFNVICRPKHKGGVQYPTGSDEAYSKSVVRDNSQNMRKGDTVTLWSINTETGQQTSIVCHG